MTLKLPIYLDYHATTPVDPRVFEAMRPYFSEVFGNAASGTHPFGWRAEEAVKKAREQVAALIHADPKEILWTSGTTESINIAILGLAKSYGENKDEIITCVTEHRSGLGPPRHLEKEGFKVTTLPVDSQGVVDLDDLRKAITPKTLLISIMAANNEIGVIHPITEIGKIARAHEVFFHVDAAQACGKIPVDVETSEIDLLSMSAHKVYGPKGIGALFVRKTKPRVRLMPLMHGGSQEEELRPGTLPVQNIVGMGVAFEIAGREMEAESKRLEHLRDRLKEGIFQRLDNVYLNGHPTERLPGNLNLSFPPVRSGDLMAKMTEIAVSSGSACASGSLEPSYVIKALGVGDERARCSIRFGLGRFTTEEEIEFTIEEIVKAVKNLRG